jgi:capsular exopolysaccharide synthesis family protein
MGRIEEALRKAKANRDGSVSRESPRGSPDPRRMASNTNVQTRASRLSQIPESNVVHADHEELREERVIAASENDERVGQYRQLRTQLLKTMRDNLLTNVAITSAHEGAGKTLTAANLAISLSMDVNTTVLLVDLDLNTPSIHQKLKLTPEKGLLDFLEGKAELEEILFDPGFDRLTVLVGRSAGKEASELLASPRMQGLMQDLCQQDEANITIFDLPPLLRNDDAILFAPYADATLLVVEEGVTTEDELQQSMRLLSKANVIGTILNKARD